MAHVGDLVRDRLDRTCVLVRQLVRAPAIARATTCSWWEAWTLDGCVLLLPESAVEVIGRPAHDQLLELVENASFEQVRELVFLFPRFTRRVLREHARRRAV